MRVVLGALLAEGFMEPLTDEAGVPYRTNALPCVQNPAAWDEDAPLAVQRVAAAACYQCPAQSACLSRWAQWRYLARGVWAGIIVLPDTTEDDGTVVYDATVAAWLVESGIATVAGSR